MLILAPWRLVGILKKFFLSFLRQQLLDIQRNSIMKEGEEIVFLPFSIFTSNEVH